MIKIIIWFKFLKKKTPPPPPTPKKKSTNISLKINYHATENYVQPESYYLWCHAL